jgi:hypothetical protein
MGGLFDHDYLGWAGQMAGAVFGRVTAAGSLPLPAAVPTAAGYSDTFEAATRSELSALSAGVTQAKSETDIPAHVATS